MTSQLRTIRIHHVQIIENKCLIEKIEKFIKRLQWKAQFFEHPSNAATNGNFGFMSNKTLPQSEHFNRIKEDFYEQIRNNEFKIILHKFFLIEDRIGSYAERNGLLALEDHKGNFRSNTQCRLLNPSKSGIGVISITFLD